MTKSRTSQALWLMLLSMACFAAMNIVIRDMASEMHSTQMVFIRNVLSFILVLLIASFQQRNIPRFTTDRLKGHLGRALAGTIAMQLWFHSITIMPVTLATALSFTTPIFATIFAMLFLKERAGWRRWSALVCGFLGTLLILQPENGALGYSAFVVLAASCAMAVAGVFVKMLSRTESPETIVFYMNAMMVVFSLPLALLHWGPITLSLSLHLLSIGVLSTVAQLMMARAYQRAEMVVLMPIDFTRLLFTALFAYMVFGETLNFQAWVGACIIVISAIYIAHREARHKKMQKIST